VGERACWVEHLRRGHAGLAARLVDAQVATHPFIIGELACGHLRNRREVLDHLGALVQAELAHQDEVLVFVERQKLMGAGPGWVDVHLLASAVLSGMPAWTLDGQLRKAAAKVGVGFEGF
jgi:hypothetical protein